jgi:hypothetical protein
MELDQKKLQVTEEASLKHYQLLVLLYLHFIDKMKQQFEGLNAVPDMKKHSNTFWIWNIHISDVSHDIIPHLLISLLNIHN